MRILIIDRDPAIFDCVETFESFECQRSNTILEAEDIIRASNRAYDLIMIRKNMGVEDTKGYRDAGLRLAEKIRAGVLGAMHQDTRICIRTMGMAFEPESLGRTSPTYRRVERIFPHNKSYDFITTDADDVLCYLIEEMGIAIKESFVSNLYERGVKKYRERTVIAK